MKATDITRQQEFIGTFKDFLNNKTLNMRKADHRHFILQIALKCADISVSKAQMPTVAVHNRFFLSLSAFISYSRIRAGHGEFKSFFVAKDVQGG